MASLQEQLLKSGLANSAKMKDINAKKRKQQKQLRKGQIEVDNEAKVSADKARQEQAEKDRLLNLKQQQAAEKKQLADQIHEMIENHKIPQDFEEGIKYSFTDTNIIKNIYIGKEAREYLLTGKYVIVKSNNTYEVVPQDIASKIEERDPAALISWSKAPQADDKDDPYADYQVPDDLIW